MNNADTKMKLLAKVYHLKNIREIIQAINIPKKKLTPSNTNISKRNKNTNNKYN